MAEWEGVDLDEGKSCRLSSNAVVESLSLDYANILTIEANKEQLTLCDTVEDILSRLEDFLGTSDMIRSDAKMSLNLTVEQIHCKCKEIEKQFERIDRLEAFVAMVKNNVNFWEDAVEKADSDMGAVGSLKKALSSFSVPFLSNKSKSPPPVNIVPRFDPVAIFQTENYFVDSADPQVNPEILINSTKFQIEASLHQSTIINCEDNLQSSTTANIKPDSELKQLPELKLIYQ